MIDTLTTTAEPGAAPRSVPCPVVRHGDLSREEFHARYVRPGRPVVIRGAMDDWPAMQRWSDPEYLPGVFGDKPAPLIVVADSSREMAPLGAFWRSLWKEGGDSRHYMNNVIREKGGLRALGELEGDIRVPGYFDPATHVASKVFAGRNTRSGLHYHCGAEAMLCQVVGRKRVILFTPEGAQFHNVYPIHWFSENVSFSHVVFGRDGTWPDLAEFRKLRDARPVECTLEPGEILYIPIYWWHVVFGLDRSISATHLWMATVRKRYLSRMGLRTNYLNKRMLRWHLSKGVLRKLSGAKPMARPE